MNVVVFSHSRHTEDDFSQGSGSFADDSYERELREYGVSQRARERGSSATRRRGDGSPNSFFEGQRRRESLEEPFDERFKDSYSDNYRGSESPVSQRDAFDERFDFRSRFFDEKLHSRERLPDRERRKEGSRDHSADNDSSGQYSGSRTPVPRHSESLSPPPIRDSQKENILPRARTPPTPTQEEPPIYSACQDSVMDFRELQEQRRKFPRAGEVPLDSVVRDESDKESLRSLPGKQRLSSEIVMLPKKIRSIPDQFDIGKFESVEARVIARKRSHEEAESLATSGPCSVGKNERTMPRVLGVLGRPGETPKPVVESDVRKDKANWVVTPKDSSLVKKEVKQVSKEKDAAKTGQVSSSSSSSRGDSEHGENELSKLHREKWLLLEKLKQLEDGGSTSDNESTSATEEDVRRVVAKRPRLDEQLASKKDLSKLKGKEELKIKVEKTRNVLGIDVSQSCRKQMEARRRLEKKENPLFPGSSAGVIVNRAQCVVKKDAPVTSHLDNDEAEEMDTSSPPEIPSEFCRKKRKGSEGQTTDAGPKTRPYRTKKSDEILSSGDERDNVGSVEKLVIHEPKKMDNVCDFVEMPQVHQSDHVGDKLKVTENKEGKPSDQDSSMDTKVSKDKKTLEHQLSISSLSSRHCDVSREVDAVKLSDSSEPVVIPTTGDPSAENLCDPRQQHRKEELVLLPLPMFALKSLSPSHLPSSHQTTSPQFHPAPAVPKLQSPCFSPNSTKSQSPMLSPTVLSSDRPLSLLSAESKTPSSHVSSQSEVSRTTSADVKKVEKELPSVEVHREPTATDQDSISDGIGEDRPMSPTGLTVEQRIKLIDEKLRSYDKFKRKKKSSDGTTSIVSYPSSIHRKEPSDVVKNLLSRSSIFDQDRKRLEQIDAKYEPKDVTVNFDPNPIKSVHRTKAAVKEMPTMLGSLTSGSSHCHISGQKPAVTPSFNSWEMSNSSTSVTLAPVTVTTSLHTSQVSPLAKLSPDPSTSSWSQGVNSQLKKACDVNRHGGEGQLRDSGIPHQQSNFPSGPIPVKRTESASSSGSSAPSASPVTPMTMPWKEGLASYTSSKDVNTHLTSVKKETESTHPHLKKEPSRDGIISSSLKRKAGHDHDSSRPKEKMAKSELKSGLSSKASAAARVEEAKAALPKLFEVDRKPTPISKDKDKSDSISKIDEKEQDKKTKVKAEESGKSERKQSFSSKSSKSPEKKLAKLSSTEGEEKDNRKDNEKKNSHHSTSKKSETKSSKPSDSSTKEKHKDISKTKHLSKESSAESDATESKLPEKMEKKKNHDKEKEKDKEKKKEKDKSKSKERKDREKDHERDRDKGSKDDEKKSEKKDKQRDKDEKSRSTEQREKDKSKKTRESDNSKHNDSSSKKKDDKEKSKSTKHKSSRSDKDKKSDVKGRSKENSDKKGKKDDRKEEKRSKPPPGLTEQDMAVFKEFGFDENESMYDKVKRRSSKADNKEKDMETMRQQLNRLHKSRQRKGRVARSEETDSSAQNSDEESNASVSTASSKRERAEPERSQKKKKKFALIMSSSSEEEDNSSFSHKVLHSEDEERKTTSKQKTKQTHSKQAAKGDFLKSDVFSPYSDDDDEEAPVQPEKLKKPPQTKRPKKKSSDTAAVKQKELVSPSEAPDVTASDTKTLSSPPKVTEDVKPHPPLPKPTILEDTSAPYKADSEGSKSDVEEKPKKQKKKKEKRSKSTESKSEVKEKSKEKKKLVKEKKKKKEKSVVDKPSVFSEPDDVLHEAESTANFGDISLDSSAHCKTLDSLPGGTEDTESDNKEKHNNHHSASTSEEKSVLFSSDECAAELKAPAKSEKDASDIDLNEAEHGEQKHRPIFQSSFHEVDDVKPNLNVDESKSDTGDDGVKSFPISHASEEEVIAKEPVLPQKSRKTPDTKHKKNNVVSQGKTSAQKAAEAVFTFNDSDSDDCLNEGRFVPRQKHKALHLHSSDEEPQDEIKASKTKAKKNKPKELEPAPRFIEKFPLEEQRLFPPILHKVKSEPNIPKNDRKSKSKRKKERKERKKKDLSPPRDLARVVENHVLDNEFPLDGVGTTDDNIVLDEHEGFFTRGNKTADSVNAMPSVPSPEPEIPKDIVEPSMTSESDSTQLPVTTQSDVCVAVLPPKDEPLTDQHAPPTNTDLKHQGEHVAEPTKKAKKKKSKVNKDKLCHSESKKVDVTPEIGKMEEEKADHSESKYLDVFASVLGHVDENKETPQETEHVNEVPQVEENVAQEPPSNEGTFNEAAEAVSQLLDTETKNLEREMIAQKAYQEMQAAVETIKEKSTTKPKRRRQRKDSLKHSETSFEAEVENPGLEDISCASMPETADNLFQDMTQKPEEHTSKEEGKEASETAEEQNEFPSGVEFNHEFEDPKDDESMAMAEDELARAVKVIEDSLAGTDQQEESPDIFGVEPIQQLPATPSVSLPAEAKPDIEPTVSTPKKEQQRKNKGRRSRGSKDDVTTPTPAPVEAFVESQLPSEIPIHPPAADGEVVMKRESVELASEVEGEQNHVFSAVKSEVSDDQKGEKPGHPPKSLLRRGKGSQQQRGTDIKDDKRYSVFQFDDKDSDNILEDEKPVTSAKPEMVENSLFETPQKVEKEDEDISPDIQSDPFTPQKEDSKSESEDTVNNRPRRRRRPPPSYKDMATGGLGLATRSSSPRSPRATRQTSSPKPFSSPKVTTSPKPCTSAKSCATPKAKDFPSPVVKLEKLPEKLPMHGKSLKVDEVSKPSKDTNLDVHHLIAELKAREELKQEQDKQQTELNTRSAAIKNVAQQLFPQDSDPDSKHAEDYESVVKTEQEPAREPRTPRKKRNVRKRKSDSTGSREAEDQPIPTTPENLFLPASEEQQLTEFPKHASPPHSDVNAETDELQLSLVSQKSAPEEGSLVIDESCLKTSSETENNQVDLELKQETDIGHSAPFGTPMVKQTSRESACYTPVTPMTPNTPVITTAPVTPMSNIERVIDAVSKGQFDENHLMQTRRRRSNDHSAMRSTVGVITSTPSVIDGFPGHHQRPPVSFPMGMNHMSPPPVVESSATHKMMGKYISIYPCVFLVVSLFCLPKSNFIESLHLESVVMSFITD